MLLILTTLSLLTLETHGFLGFWGIQTTDSEMVEEVKKVSA